MAIRSLLISLFLPLLLASGGAWAQNPVGTCPAGVSSSFPGCYPFIQGGALAPTDGVAVVQAGANPLSRIASVSQLLAAVGTDLPSLNVIGNATIGGTLGVIGAARFSGITQNLATTWSGGFPNGNTALYSTQTYTGTPTGSGFPDSSGHSIPLNLGYISSEQLNWPGGPGGVVGWEFKHQYGGGSASGGRNTVIIDSTLTGTIAAGNNHYFALQMFSGTNGANVAGAASGSGNGLGQFGGMGMNCTLGNGTFAHEQSCAEWDIIPAAGSSRDYGYGLKIINFAPTGMHANIFEDMMELATSNPATESTFNNGLYFGDPQAADGQGFPISSTGTMIGSAAGTAGIGIDFSADTLTTLLKGPSNFAIDGTNKVHTDSVQSASGATVSFFDSLGNPEVQISRTGASPNNYIALAGAPNGSTPVLSTVGNSDTTVGMMFKTATGNGNFQWQNTTNDTEFEVIGVAAAISYPVFTPAASGGSPLLSVGGTAANLKIDVGSSNSVQVQPNGGATTIGGTLGVTGAITGSLIGGASLDLPLAGGTVTGATTFSSTLTGTLTGGASLDLPLAGGTVSGATTFSSSGTALTVTNNATISGTLLTNTLTSVGTTLNVGTATATAVDIGSAISNVLIGSGSVLATTATIGFPLIPSSAGTPTGTVTGVGAGKVAIEIDTTDKKLCYSVAGGTWECSAAFTP